MGDHMRNSGAAIFFFLEFFLEFFFFGSARFSNPDIFFNFFIFFISFFIKWVIKQ